MSVYAIELDFIGIGNGSSSGGSNISGSYLVPHLDTNPAVGYRFAVIDNVGSVAGRVIDVYHSDYVKNEEEYKYKPVAWTWSVASGGDGKTRRRSKQELLQMCKGTVNWSVFGNPDASSYNHNSSLDIWTTCEKLGLNEFTRYPEQISSQITPAKLDKILAYLGTSCSAILSDSASVSVEPIFEARVQGKNICGTVTDLAIILRKIDSDDVPPSPSNRENVLATITRATNREFPNMLHMPDKNGIPNATQLLWTNAPKIGDSSVANYSTLMLKGYGVGICYGKVVNNTITINYHNKTGSGNAIVKTTKIPRGSVFNLSYASGIIDKTAFSGREFVGWNMYNNYASKATQIWGFAKNGKIYEDGWYSKSKAGVTISNLVDHAQLNSAQTNPLDTSEIHLYPVRSSQQFVHIGYYVDYDAYQAGTDIGNSIYYYGGASDISYTKLYKTKQAGNTAPLFWPGGQINGMDGNYDVLPAVNTKENTSNKYRSFTGWVIYNDAKKKWCGYNEAADSFDWYDSYEKAAANQIATTYMRNSTKYKGSYSNYNDVKKLNDFFGKYCYNTTGNIGNYYVVGVYKGELCNLRYKTAMTDSATVSGYLNSVGSGISDTTAWNNYFSTCLNPLDQIEDINREDVAWAVYWTDENKENTSWWESPGYPWDTNDAIVYIQNEQPVDYNKLKIEKAEYSVCPLTDCYTSEQLNNFVNLGSTKHLPEEHFEGFEFGGWTFITTGTLYYGYDNNNVLGWYTLDKINKNKTNSDTSYYGFYIMQPEEALKDSFFETGNRERNINFFALWKELPTYTVNYYEDGKSLGSQKIDASTVIAAQTNGKSYQFYSRYNSKLSSRPNSSYNYLGWSYDSSADAILNIGFEESNGDDKQCFSGYETYSSTVLASPTGFTWQTDSSGNKYINLYSIKSLKPKSIRIKYYQNIPSDTFVDYAQSIGDYGYKVNLGDSETYHIEFLDKEASAVTSSNWEDYAKKYSGTVALKGNLFSKVFTSFTGPKYFFLGWKDISTGTVYNAGDNIDASNYSADVLNLYAIWGKYEVFFKANAPADATVTHSYPASEAATDSRGVSFPHKQVVGAAKASFALDENKFYDSSDRYDFTGWKLYRYSNGEKEYLLNSHIDSSSSSTDAAILQNADTVDRNWLIRFVGSFDLLPGAEFYLEAQWSKKNLSPQTFTVKYNPNADKNHTVNGHSADYVDSSGVTITGNMPDQVITYGIYQDLRDVTGSRNPQHYYKYPNYSFVGWVAYRVKDGETKGQYYAYTSADLSNSRWMPKSAVNSNFGEHGGYHLFANNASVGKIAPAGYTVTMFAVWKANACSVQFVSNTRCGVDNYITSMPESVIASIGDKFTVPSDSNSTPKLKNSNELEFIGWNTAYNGTGTSYPQGETIELSKSILNENDVLVLYAQWRVNIDVSVEEIYYSTDSNGSYRVDNDTKLKEDGLYYVFATVKSNSNLFDISFNLPTIATIAGSSLMNTNKSAEIGHSEYPGEKDTYHNFYCGEVKITPPSEDALRNKYFTADDAIVTVTGTIAISSATRNGNEIPWAYTETNYDNNSKELDKYFLINAPHTYSSHQSPSSNVYSGQLVSGIHSYSNMSLFNAVFSCFAKRYDLSNMQIKRFDNNFIQYNSNEELRNNVSAFSSSSSSNFSESKTYRYRNANRYPISFRDAYSRMSWIKSNPELFDDSHSTITVYPIDLIADNINVYKGGGSTVYNKGVSPEESYNVEGVYLLKTMLNPINELHVNLKIAVFGVTADGDKEYICEQTILGEVFSQYIYDPNEEVYIYTLRLKTDSFIVDKRYTDLYINGYVYDSNLINTSYSTYFEQNGDNNTFEKSVPVVSPFNLSFIEPNAYYTREKDVVSGFRISNSSPYNLKNDVGYTISVYGTNKIDKNTVPIARKTGLLGAPTANSTMAWIKWSVPKDMSDTAYIKIIVDTGAVYNTETITAEWGVKNNLVFNTPDTTYSDKAPSWYSDSIGTENASNMSSYNLDYNNKGNDVDSFSWDYFTYDNATDSYQIVTNKVSANGTAVISKKGCPDTDDGSIKSGYGYGLNVNTSITSTAPEDAVTDCQNAYVAFPEFNNAVTGKADNYYQFSLDTAANYLINPAGVRSGFKNIGSSMANISADKHNEGSYGTFATLKKSGDNFGLPKNSSTGDATHFIPIWMPDGDYEVTGIIDEIWTPMGMISKKIVSNTLKVDGNMYDDFKVSHYTIKQAE